VFYALPGLATAATVGFRLVHRTVRDPKELAEF
jgi:hypothetical protein